jgi:hypothetical protein
LKGVLAGRAGLRDGGECGTLRSVRSLVPSRRPPRGLSRRHQGASSPGIVHVAGGMLPPGDGVIGLRQVDEMAQMPLSCRSKIPATFSLAKRRQMPPGDSLQWSFASAINAGSVGAQRQTSRIDLITAGSDSMPRRAANPQVAGLDVPSRRSL